MLLPEPARSRGAPFGSRGGQHVQHQNGRIAVLDATDGHLLTVLRPPWPSYEAGNLLVGGGMVFEGVLRTGTPPEPAGVGAVVGVPELLAFGTS